MRTQVPAVSNKVRGDGERPANDLRCAGVVARDLMAARTAFLAEEASQSEMTSYSALSLTLARFRSGRPDCRSLRLLRDLMAVKGASHGTTGRAVCPA